MKEYSLNKLTLIGKGGVGYIYRINDEQIIKVFNHITIQKLEERKLWARELFKAGVPTAISFETAIVGDQYGIVYELLHSKTVGQQLIENPEKMEQSGIKMGNLLKTIHSCKINAPKAKKIKHMIVQWAEIGKAHGLFTTKDIRVIKKILAAVPDTNTVLHCDFHEGNVMMQNGEYILIDIDDSCVGHPLFDLTLHYLNHEVLSHRPDLMIALQGITPKISKSMAKLTRECYFRDMEPEKAKLYIKLSKALLPLMMAVSSVRAIESSELMNEQNRKIVKYVEIPALHLSQNNVIKNLNKLRQLESEAL